MKTIETILTPTLLPLYSLEGRVAVVIDVLRATTSICTALQNGATAVIPIAEKEQAKAMRAQGYIVASERKGLRLEFANYGNSPHEFTPARVGGREIVYCTTNGTKTIKECATAAELLIGAFANLDALAEYLIAGATHDVSLICSGWMGRFNIEDALLAGAIAKRLTASGKYSTTCDSTIASTELWGLAKGDLKGYAEKVEHCARLTKYGLRRSFDDCMRVDTCTVVPRYAEGKIVPV